MNKPFNIVDQLNQLFKQGREAGIDIQPSEEKILTYEQGIPATETQKKVADHFEAQLQKHVEKTGMSRREFLKSPLSMTAAVMAMSSGLGFALFPRVASANPSGSFLQPLPFVQFGNPTMPLNPVDFAAADKANVDFSNMVAVVVGGSSGMGRAGVERLKNNVGFGHVVATSRDPNLYPDFPDNIDFQKLDVTIPGQVEAFGNYLKNNYGKVNLLHLNAGRLFTGRPTESDPKKVDLLQETNYGGLVRVWRKVEPLLPHTGYARLLLTSSSANNHVITPPGPLLGPAYGGAANYSYFESKRRLTAFGLALDATIKNNLNPASGRPPGGRKNLKVSIVHPCAVVTNLAKKGILAENNQFVVDEQAFFDGALNAIGVPPDTPGLVFEQLALLENPCLTNYIFDQNYLDIENDIIAFGQFLTYTFMAYEDDTTLRTFVNPIP